MKRAAAKARRQDDGAAAVLTSGHWEVQMLGGLRARSGDVVLQRFPTRAIACLLARLALQPQRDHSREELAELLWRALPHAQPLAPDALRSRLRNALSTLRTLLEPPGHRAGPVLLTDRLHVRLNAALVHTDVAQFERLCQTAAADPAAAQAARALYRGELLPGYDDDWVRDRRHQLADLYENLHQAHRPDTAHNEARLAHPAYAGVAAQRVAGPQSGRRLLAYVTPFFGREDEILQLQKSVHEHSLLHLVGPGGCGKTRLAVQWALQDRSFDSIHLVPLQECPSPSGVMDQVRAALDLQATRAPAIDQVADRLQGSAALLILDSCEHLMPGSSVESKDALQRAAPATLEQALDSLQQRLPQLRLLLTSRRAMQAGSPRMTLLPLPVPAPQARGAPSAAQALASPSVALFVDRARAVRADFTLHARNVDAVVQLCRLLDGLPVLIEIAASRTRHYSPRELCNALSTSITVLQRTGPAASRAGHHTSVQALLQWSWRHLDPPAQAMLGAVVVFRGGWTLPAAAAVAQCSLAQCADALQALAEHHLVHTELDASGLARWQMLGVVREQISTWVPADHATRHRELLREHLLAWAQSLQARHEPYGQAETQNVEQALAGALFDDDAAGGMALALTLQWPWVAVGVSARVQELLEQLAHRVQEAASPLPTPGAPASAATLTPAMEQAAAFHSLRARLLMLGGYGHAALQAAELALQCAGEHAASRADALQAWTSLCWRRQPDVASVLPAAQEACSLAQAGCTLEVQARAAVLLGSIIVTQGTDLAAAQRLFEQASELYAGVGDRAGELSVLPGLITCLHAQGQNHQALARAHAGLAQAQALGHVETQLLLFNRLSTSHEMLRRHRQVVRVNQQQLQLARRHGLVYHQAIAVWNQSLALVRLRQAHQAVLLMAFAERWWTTSFGGLDADEKAELQDLRDRASRLVGAALCAQLWTEGAAMPQAAALDLAASV